MCFSVCLTIVPSSQLRLVYSTEMSELVLMGGVRWSMGFSGGSDGKESAHNAGDLRSPGEQKGYPLQYSCLANSMDNFLQQS